MKNYVGIPYKKGGTDRSGVDCWGLARLVYRERLGIDLPAFSAACTGSREDQSAEVARQREGWSQVIVGEPMDLVLCRTAGLNSHIGILTGPGKMLHAMPGTGSVVESITGPRWGSRVTGFFRYKQDSVTISGCPHPLKTTRIGGTAPAGTTLGAIIADAMCSTGYPVDADFRGAAWVDGRPVPPELWASTIPDPGSRVEFRVVPGSGSVGRIVAMVAVLALSAWAGPALAGAMNLTGVAATGVTTLTTAGKIVAGVTSVAVASAGMMLTNALFPVRATSAPNPGTAESINVLSGGTNTANKYGAIPVVLGRMRYAPPLAAETWAETGSTTTYLHMALCWGYGDLQISDIRVGDTDIATLEKCTYVTLRGDASDAARELFDNVYGGDTTQLAPGTKMTCTKCDISTISRVNNVVTVVAEESHGLSAGDYVVIRSGVLEGAAGEITDVVNSTTFKFSKSGSDVQSTESSGYFEGSSWTEKTISSDVDQIKVTLYFPEGCRKMPTEGGNAGDVDQVTVCHTVQIRQLDSDTLSPVTGWGNIDRQTVSRTFELGSAWFQFPGDQDMTSVYQWTRISVDEYGRLIYREGCLTDDPDGNPSDDFMEIMQTDIYGVDASFERLPDLGTGEESLYDILVHGDVVQSVIDNRDETITGCGMTRSGRTITVAAGTIDRASSENVVVGSETTGYYKRKDAFFKSVIIDVAHGCYDIRVRRTTYSDQYFSYPSGNDGVNYFSSYLSSITGFMSSDPITPPVDLAMTAIRVKATDQVNGTLDTVEGTVISKCLTYRPVYGDWVELPTRNPAALYRHVLQHPANSRAVPDSALDLDALADWHTYCAENGFHYDNVISSQRSLMDVLRDVAAAGRASPQRVNGKWSVVIDREKTEIVQHITPHNSWGFSAERVIPEVPHAFRVQFVNSDRGYQADERIVYADGYGSSTATLFEGLVLPGVTESDIVYKQARYHLAQLILRPEIYYVNMDVEHLICTRGDLVRMSHDVPMWGIGDGRISKRVSSTELSLGNSVYLESGARYTIRIRSVSGSSTTRTVEAPAVSGYAKSITLTQPVTSAQADAGDLFLLGELLDESMELLVQEIEPADNMSARLTLVDYAPDIFDSDTETIPDFDSGITSAANAATRAISYTPTLGEPVSDESVMTVIGPGQYAYRIKLPFSCPATMPATVTGVEAQIDYVGDSLSNWSGSVTAVISAGTVSFSDVDEGEEYRMRMRFTASDGRTGPWVTTGTHTVTGKSTVPALVTGLSATMSGERLYLDWDDNSERDVAGYEVRSTDSGWGSPGYLFRGAVSSCSVTPPAAGDKGTWYVRAYDSGGLYSASSGSISWSSLPPAACTNMSATVTDNIVQLSWTLPAATTLPVDHVRILKGATFAAAVEVGTKSGAFTTITETLAGEYTYWVVTVDSEGYESEATSVTVAVDDPADYVLHGTVTSTFSGTLTNAGTT